MKEYIEERAIQIANYIIDENATVRQTAKRFGISKSTVHKDVTDRLIHIDPSLAAQARVVLDINKAERHIRGGLATKEKYEHEHQLQACSRVECEWETAADNAAENLREKISVSTKGLKTDGKIRLNFQNTAIEWEQDCF